MKPTPGTDWVGLMEALPTRVTQLLEEWRAGSEEALERLVEAVYPELKKIARSRLRRERPDHTLQTTALVNEAYLRVVDQRDANWQSRAHFFAICSKLMRRILVDHARKRRALKRGAGGYRITMDDGIGPQEPRGVDLLALDLALEALEEIDSVEARVVELRFFGGLTIDETAEVLGSSSATVERRWKAARAWLRIEMDGRPDEWTESEGNK